MSRCVYHGCYLSICLTWRIDTADGLIMSKLINDSVPDTIDTRVLNFPRAKALNAFQITENNNIVIMSAKAIGCSVVNIGPSDIADGREHLILGLIWQIIRKGLLSRVDIKHHPELYRLLYEDEQLEDFLKLPPDQILLRWFNYHLKAAGWKRKCVATQIAQPNFASLIPNSVIESTTSAKTSTTARITLCFSTN